MEMAQLMKAGKQLIYVDESMFYSTLTCDRVWVYRGMTLSKPRDKYSCSVIGAISDKQGLLHY
jgi:predicted chitinase